MALVDYGADVVCIPGAYVAAVRAVVEAQEGPDYRYVLHWPARRWERYKAKCVARVEGLFAEVVESGEPVERERWRFGGRSLPIPPEAPDWLRDPNVMLVRVFPDDSVEPA